jgi:glutathione S-transferase
VKLFGLATNLDDAKAIAARLLTFMDQHLADGDWLAGEGPTLADVACYPYVACAPDGEVDLAPYPAVRAWIKRFEALPGVKAMPRQEVPA